MKKEQAYKQFKKEYTNKLKSELKLGLDKFSLDFFITYLKYIRDSYILKVDMTSKASKTDPKLISITAALSEYDKYENCIYKYFSADGKKNKKLAGKKEDALLMYIKERDAHWKCFWDLVAVDIKEWMKNENTVQPNKAI